MVQFTGRSDTVQARFIQEEIVFKQVSRNNLAFGLGTTAPHMDGAWLAPLLSGGLVDLALYSASLFLLPVGLLLSLPSRRPHDREVERSAGWMALFLTLNAIDSLHNLPKYVTSFTLVAGSLTGIASTGWGEIIKLGLGSVGSQKGPVRHPIWQEAKLVAAFACGLYIFGHGPVKGYETIKLIGGLGAPLLFGAAGWVADWASQRFPLYKLAAFAGLFALFGVSFNLALYPSRSIWASDILQGMAMAGFAVACSRKVAVNRAWIYPVVAIVPLLIHFILGPLLPEFPGTQFLVTGSSVDLSFFPLCPWLTFAALGAWSRHESMRTKWVMAGLFAATMALNCWTGSGSNWPVKIPMDLSYALLGCASVMVAVALAQALATRGQAARALEWLGRNWLVFFYLHFALIAVLSRSSVQSPGAVWLLLAVGTVGATWAVSVAAGPFVAWFRKPFPWVVLLGVIVAAAVWPGMHQGVVTGVAGVAGLVFAAQVGALASWVTGFEWTSATKERPSASKRFEASLDRETTYREPLLNLARLAAVLVLLATPELLGLLTGAMPRQPGPPKPSKAANPRASDPDSPPEELSPLPEME
jgi:hypothetical protein